MSAEKKEYKWQVKQGGTVPVDAMGISHAMKQSGEVFDKQRPLINKGGEQAPKIGTDAQGVAHAVNAPKPPSTVNAVEKDKSVRHNHSGY
eukprot:m.6761 g.6761  ORF g.6761 m.6761 type:complete len:90 (+) comp5188_c0_seq1:85-354(+)